MLQEAISLRQDPKEVARVARELAAALIAAHPVPLTPAESPDLARGAALYVEQCAACHGANGDGRGPAAANLDPPPIAFADRERARERSVFGLYQVIEQGLDGTSMPSFASLPAGDKWALAFYVGTLGFPKDLEASGGRVWRSDAELRARTTMESLVTKTPAELMSTIGESADALTAFLRRHPSELAPATSSGLSIARAKLRAAEAAYRTGQENEARELALSAYLDGFESVEPTLASHDAQLLAEVEVSMARLRSDIASSLPAAKIAADVRELETLLVRAELSLRANNSSATSSFIGSFTILLREGLEALLLVVSMIAFLRKADRSETIRHVHAGWIAALIAGVATWGIATMIISVSGASRELTEGLGSVLAALVLLWVGVWMHGKSQADAWQKYIREHMGRALSRGSAWFLFALSFLVVYREVFETILFYAALWEQGHTNAVLGGAAVAAVALGAVAIMLLRLSRRLPIAQFFAYSSLLIAVLAIVLIGKGTAALQEAGYLTIRQLQSMPRIEWLGMFPTVESLLAQIAMVVLLAIGFVWTRRHSVS
jgi:high-affinity iron transporter